MDGVSLVALAERFLDQKQDLAFSFSGAEGSFVVVGFTATETVNAPFEIVIDLASEDPNIDLHALMDRDACLGIFDKYSQPRFLHGIVTEVEKGQSGIRRTFYSVVLRPSIHRLAHTSDSRIWQDKNIPDLVREVLEEHHIVNVEWRLGATYAVREYATQYRETAFDFIMRVLAEEGIFYFFEHSEAGHKLVITDAPLATPVLEHAEHITCNTNTGGQSRGNWISQFSQRERLRSSAYQMGDYTFKNPSARMAAMRSQQENNGLQGEYPLYDFPGRYKEPDQIGDAFTKHRIESVRVDATTGHGVTNNVHLSAGYHFTITDHEDDKANASQFILSVTHTGRQTSALEEDAGSEATTYEAGFATMPARLPYRPPLARKPLVDGPQIAMVTGPEGEEIYTDEHARIKCHFYWDRRSNKDEHSSCWIRVSQNWAGGTWGHMAIPRIGQSVIVDFLEGDPDQPIVTGRTYHATERPPYNLPEHKTRMTIKSDTHKGQGFNELRFEDEAGREEVFVHAQKDLTEKIENHHTTRVDRTQVLSVGRNSLREVAGKDETRIGGDMTIVVSGSNRGKIVSGRVADNIEGVRRIGYELDRPTSQQRGAGSFQLDAAGNISLSTTKNMNILAEKDKVENTGGNSSLNVDGNYATTVGKSQRVSVGKNLFIDVVNEIHFRCGPTTIKMSQDGRFEISGDHIIINGRKVNIN